MADLSAAIAAAREALAKYQDREVRHYIDEAMEGLLAALDAAQPVAWHSPRVASFNFYDSFSPIEQRSDGWAPLYLAPQALPAAADAWAEGYKQGVQDERTSEANIGICGFGGKVEPARENPYGTAPPAAVPAANVTPMRQPRADLARLVESINAAVYANGDGLSVTEAIGALELAKLELLKEQEQ